MDVVVSLTAPSTSTVSVNYATSAETASYNADYRHVSGTLTFAAGETSKVVRVQILQDTYDEGYEQFWFTLDNAVNAVAVNNYSTISIYDFSNENQILSFGLSVIILSPSLHSTSGKVNIKVNTFPF